MSYILVATDFSPIAENSVAYAAALAAHYNRRLVIMHTFTFPMLAGEAPIPASLIDETVADAESQLADVVRNISAANEGLSVQSIVLSGPLTNAVEKYMADHGQPWLIVMGNSNTAEDSVWFFSTLNEAAHVLKEPILAIPANATYVTPARICLALDIAQPENTTALGKLMQVTTAMDSELHVLNVQKDGFNRDNIADVSGPTKSVLAHANPHYHFRYHADVDATIREFCTDTGATILAVIPGNYDFFSGIFHKSHTKALAKSADIPLLILTGNE